MRSSRILVFLALCAVAAGAAAQSPVFGPEFLVNSTTTSYQYGAAVANLGAACDFVVAWTADAQDGDKSTIIARRFDAAGAPLGGEFQVNAASTGYQGLARIGSNPAGDFVITWTEYGGPSSYEVRARRFNSAGVAQGGDIAVNTYTTGVQSRSAVAVNTTGAFVIVWNSGPDSGSVIPGQDGDDFGVFGQRFDNAGVKTGAEFQVNQFTTSYQARPRIAIKPSGEFIVVWNSPQDDQIGAVMARRYDAAGAPLGGEFQVNTTELGAQYTPDVGFDASGNADVVWTSYGQDGSGAGVFGQRLDPAGNKLGPEFNVNTYTTGFQGRPRLAVGPEGDFTVIWSSFAQDGDGSGVYAQHFDATGRRDTAELPINAYTTVFQGNPTVAAQPNGQFVAAWESFGQDGSDYGIEARVTGFPAAKPAKVDQRPSNGVSNVNGVLESGEKVNVDPGYRNPGAASLSLTGTASNFTGPPGDAYLLGDTSADYGSVAAGAEANCFDATANCYDLTVSGPRLVPHWDATFDETLSYHSFVKRWTLHVGPSFPDVPQNVFYPFIENLFHNGVTGGCGGGGYCPGNNVTRAQMAVFLLKARYGSGFTPAPATGTVFTDVPASNPFAPWIEELSREGITGGCGTGIYCPNNAVTRQQMAIFLLKTKYGSTYAPPAGVGLFGDVAGCPGIVCNFIEELYNEGVTGGCQTVPVLNYCPANPNLRQQMAVFLVKTFGLQLYGN